MSRDINISGEIDVKEPFCSMGYCNGSLSKSTEMVGFKRLTEIKKKEEALIALSKVIEELDKDDSGVFNNEWCSEVKLDEQLEKSIYDSWSALDILLKKNAGLLNIPFETKNEFFANAIRTDMRKVAVRFYLYYKSGFEITFE